MKAVFIKSVIFPIARHFFAEFDRLDAMPRKSLDDLCKFEAEYVKLVHEFEALPAFVQKLVGETRKSYITE